MEKIVLSKRQSKAIAQVIYTDVKDYCQKNIGEYVAWFIDDIRKSKGQPPIEQVAINLDYCAYLKYQDLCTREDYKSC